MKKRFFLILGSLLSSIALAFGLTACSCNDDDKSNCKHTSTETIVTNPATCTEDGYEEETCTACKAVLETRFIDALGHDYELDETKTSTATCTTAGITYYVCDNYPCTETLEEETGALGHNYLTEAGTTAKACQDGTCACGAGKIAEAMHTLVENERVATCEAAGLKTTACSVCEEVIFEETLEQLDHDIDEDAWVTTQDFTKVTGITECKYSSTQTAECTLCHKPQTRKITVDHHFVSKVTEEATCTKNGTRETVCEGCNEKNTAVEAITLVGAHTWNNNTCTTCGKTQITVSDTTTTVSKVDLAGSEIKFEEAGLTMDQSIVNSIEEGAKIELSVQKSAKENLTNVDASVVEKLGNAPIYDMTMKVGNEPKHELGGNVTVTIPYTLQEGETPDNITIAYINGSTIETVKNAEYWEDEAGNGFVTFSTDHFSYYSVRRLTDKELCEDIYGGHHYARSYKKATCIYSGYDLEICTRCGHKSETSRGYIAPLGHSLTEVENKLATCTAIGKKTETCTLCENTYYTFTVATGHTWGAEDRKEATCQAAGYSTKTCTTCEAVYREEFAQTPHNYKVDVTNATCTVEGITVYTCQTAGCDRSYRGDATPALGHDWNIDEATCVQGQVCKRCEAEGNPATGKHTMENGACTECGYGCTHNFTVIDEKAVSCTEDGYVTKKCSKCNVEETTTTQKIGHVYNGGSVCTVCGEGNVETIKTFLASLLTDGYTVKFNNYSISATTKYLPDNKEQNEMTMKFDVAEAYLTVQGDKVLAYMQMKGTVGEGTDLQEINATLYGDGDNIYVYTSDTYKDDPNVTANEMFLRYSYIKEMPNLSFSADASEGETTVGSFEEMFNMMLEKLQLPQVEAVIEMLLAKEDAAYGVLMQAMEYLFVTTETADGYTIALDMNKFKQLNEALYTKTLDQVFDQYVGEGAFEDVREFVLGLEEMTLGEAATAIIDYADSNGFDTKIIFTAIETVAEMPEGTIEQYLQNPKLTEMTIPQAIEMMMGSMGGDNVMPDGDYNQGGSGMVKPPVEDSDNDYNQGGSNSGSNGGNVEGNVGGNGSVEENPSGDKVEIKDEATIKPMALMDDEATFDYSSAVNMIFDKIKSINVYDLYAQAMGEGATTTKEDLYDMLNTVFDGYSLVFTTDKDMNVQSMQFAINLDDLQGGYDQAFVNGGYIKTEEYYVSVNVDLLVNFGNTTIPSGETTSKAKTEYETKYTMVSTALMGGMNALEDKTLFEVSHYENDPVLNVLKLENGKLNYYRLVNQEFYEGLPDDIQSIIQAMTPSVTDITLWEGTTIEQKCGAWWRIRFTGEMGNLNLSVYVNVETQTVYLTNEYYSNDGGHSIKPYMPVTIPNGIKLDPSQVDCDEYYYMYGQCELCNKVFRDSKRKWHEEGVVEVALVDGAESCEDGVIVTYQCILCDRYTYSGEEHYHATKIETFATITTDHGDIVIRKVVCACGEETTVKTGDFFAYYYWDDANENNACLFNSNNGDYQEEGDAYYDATANSVYVYSCVIEDCTHVLVEYYLGNNNKTYKVFDGSKNLVGGITYTLSTIDSGDPCVSMQEHTWTAFGKTNNTLETLSAIDQWDSHDTEYTSLYSETADGGWTSGSRGKCEDCAYENYYMTTYDANGREKSYKSYTKSKTGEWESYYEKTYTFASTTSCEAYVTYVYNAPAEEGGKVDTGTETIHYYDRTVLVAPTCSQVGKYQYECQVCGMQQEERGYYWLHDYDRDHDWQPNPEGSAFLYKCADCGLESDRPYTYIVMEDLTNHEVHGEDGFYTIGFRDWRNNWYYNGYEYFVTFEFEKLDGSGETVAIPNDTPINHTWASAYDETWYPIHYSYWYRDTMIRFSKADVQAAATAAGIDLSEYGLSIQLIPTDNNLELSDKFVLTDF